MGTNNSANYAPVQHDVLIGAASGGITSVAPSATSGVPFISQGAAADPTFGTAVVAGGGTGATTLTGVLSGNGTSALTVSALTNHSALVGGASNALTSVGGTTGTVYIAGGASADPQFTLDIKDASGSVTMPNTSCFFAYLNATVNNVTGDNTGYTIIFNATLFDQASNFNTGTGTFTAPVTGRYLLVATCNNTGITSAHTSGSLQIQTNSGGVFTSYRGSLLNVGAVNTGGTCQVMTSVVCDMSANDTATVIFSVGGSTKTVNAFGSAGTTASTFFCGQLLC
jgi:hypothetical protein